MRDKLPRIIQTAYDWHGGQDSALYSFASTGGVVWSEDHRRNLIGEIAGCRGYRYVDPVSDRRETARLDRLEAYIRTARVLYCYESRRMMTRRGGE